MVFSSHLFLLVFLPLTLLGFHALAQATRAPVWPRRFLILASLVFYGAWSWVYLLMLVATIVATFALGRLIVKRAARPVARRLMWLGIVGNLGLLGYFKYANFFLDNLNAVLATHWSLGAIVLPLAISFHTFQQISFLVNVREGRDAETSLETYLLFVLFFPQLIAGPIVRHDEVAPQLATLGRGRDRALDLAVGSALFSAGLAKKTLLADPLATYANAAFNAAQAGAVDPAIAWLGALAYTLQLYFDFSGYSEMAVGLGRMFGVKLPINFWSPYRALNIADFWRRWHITLSRFLRDYLYIRLGGNRTAPLRTYLNLLLTMALGGLWHGAAWTFVVWGVYHGALLAVHRWYRGLLPTPWKDSQRFGGSLGLALTFLLVMLGWVLFRAADLQAAWVMYTAMAKLAPAALGALDPWAALHVGSLLAVALLLPNTWQWIGGFHPVATPAGQPPRTRLWAWSLDWRWAMGIAALGAWTVLAAHRYTEFLYFQF
ncbi:MAG: MBOAT family protein [Betaproteobacteria bacterium]|nr:MBOAT family protein [Betaproteobacteria bacterium]